MPNLVTIRAQAEAVALLVAALGGAVLMTALSAAALPVILGRQLARDRMPGRG